MELALVGALVGALLVGTGPLAKPRLPQGTLRVPAVTQQTSYSCGAASLFALLKYWKRYEGTEKDLYSLLKTHPEAGTAPENLVRGARKLGLEAAAAEHQSIDDLAEALGRGVTPILDIQAWKDDPDLEWEEAWEEGHYVVAIGIDDYFVYAMDPVLEGTYGYIPLEELPDRWHDYEGSSVETGRKYEALAIYVEGRSPEGAAAELLPLERIE